MSYVLEKITPLYSEPVFNYSIQEVQSSLQDELQSLIWLSKDAQVLKHLNETLCGIPFSYDESNKEFVFEEDVILKAFFDSFDFSNEQKKEIDKTIELLKKQKIKDALQTPFANLSLMEKFELEIFDTQQILTKDIFLRMLNLDKNHKERIVLGYMESARLIKEYYQTRSNPYYNIVDEVLPLVFMFDKQYQTIIKYGFSEYIVPLSQVVFFDGASLVLKDEQLESLSEQDQLSIKTLKFWLK